MRAIVKNFYINEFWVNGRKLQISDILWLFLESFGWCQKFRSHPPRCLRTKFDRYGDECVSDNTLLIWATFFYFGATREARLVPVSPKVKLFECFLKIVRNQHFVCIFHHSLCEAPGLAVSQTQPQIKISIKISISIFWLPTSFHNWCFGRLIEILVILIVFEPTTRMIYQ